MQALQYVETTGLGQADPSALMTLAPAIAPAIGPFFQSITGQSGLTATQALAAQQAMLEAQRRDAERRQTTVRGLVIFGSVAAGATLLYFLLKR